MHPSNTPPPLEPLKDVLPPGKDQALEALDQLQERASYSGEMDPTLIASVIDWLRKVVVAQYATEERSAEEPGAGS